ncbi:MAG: site-specific integrase [Deltaproteobacteria bacterium]|nr:site-specific integrase [Deltaproteobacteria bacterium]
MEQKNNREDIVMGVYQKGNRWYIDYYLPEGRRKREVVGHTKKVSKTVAEKALKARIGEIVQGKFSLEKANKPALFDRLVERYLEYARDNHRAYKRDVTISKVLLKFFNKILLGNITSWHVEKIKSHRKGEGKSLSTINRELTVLKRVFNLGIQWGLTNHNPVKGVKFFKITSGKLRVLSVEEFQRLYYAASDHLKPILQTAISTGMRRGEVLNLKWEDIDFKTGVIYVKDSKNYEPRSIPMSERLKETLEELRRNCDSEYLFPNTDGTPIESVNRSFHTALRKSGIAYGTFHSLGHTFATWAVMAGVDIVALQEILGHKTIAMTKRYSHPTPEHKKKAMELVSIDTSSRKAELPETNLVDVTGLNKRGI